MIDQKPERFMTKTVVYVDVASFVSGLNFTESTVSFKAIIMCPLLFIESVLRPIKTIILIFICFQKCLKNTALEVLHNRYLQIRQILNIIVLQSKPVNTLMLNMKFNFRVVISAAIMLHVCLVFVAFQLSSGYGMVFYLYLLYPSLIYTSHRFKKKIVPFIIVN